MVAPKNSPNAEELPLPQQRTVKRPMPKTPAELEARHRKVKEVVVAVAKMLVPR